VDLPCDILYSDSQCTPAARSGELLNLSSDDVDTIMEQVLLKQGLNEEDSLGNLKSKFDVSYVYSGGAFIHPLLASTEILNI